MAALGRNPGVVPPAGPPVEPSDEDLSFDNVRSIVVSRVLGKTWRDADFVHDVGGSPVAVAEFAGRLTLAGSTFDPRQMLNREAEDRLLGARSSIRRGSLPVLSPTTARAKRSR